MITEYVTFRLANQVFALPLERVREIIRLPEVAHVPLAPPSLVGLANLRGILLPVVCLNNLLCKSNTSQTDSTRVVVAENSNGSLVGFVVDRMDRVLNADSSKMDSADIMQDTVQSEYLVGVLKNTAGHPMILIFDLDRLMAGEYAQLGHKTSSSGSGLDSGDHGLRHQSTMEEETQLVTFLLDRQEYAFPIQRVREIVRIPANIGQVPKAAPYLLGMINLREELLPLVSLRRIFGMGDDSLDEQSRIGVIDLEEEDEGISRHLVGVVMDRVREVLRVPTRTLEPTPELLRDGDAHPSVTSVCRLAQGRRLVSVLQAEHLLDHHALREKLAAHLPQEESTMGESGKKQGVDRLVQMVVFQLNREEYGVAIESVQEIIRLPDEVAHVPKAPPYIEGMVNLRGTLLPVVDLRVRLGMPHLERTDRQRILVINMAGKRTGFIVDSVSEVKKIYESVLEEAPHFSDEQSQFVKKVANLDQQKRMIMIIELASMMENMAMRE